MRRWDKHQGEYSDVDLGEVGKKSGEEGDIAFTYRKVDAPELKDSCKSIVIVDSFS